ncbi:uncharacterized protein CMU_038680 [Cryptosporidium muris RN66]|uniref:Uncharacterized protein n=1 Tax=Cryptosporidium muris (strain RN66) TaxID=441375 RepID=B6A9B0_CRYMR|nr:uncharacterized protein CMU_038680 [Cryptosporidium muris RN66]EEA04801.1 hypothetical protein CMU_038680 [Cryptosporidium muris RN66]|eukprot:XP_002139150.1 hypothetical protein [Cryptosporidium muris RN66]
MVFLYSKSNCSFILILLLIWLYTNKVCHGNNSVETTETSQSEESDRSNNKYSDNIYFPNLNSLFLWLGEFGESAKGITSDIENKEYGPEEEFQATQLDIVESLVDSLEYASNSNIVFQKIYEDNIMLNIEGEFSLSQLIENLEENRKSMLVLYIKIFNKIQTCESEYKDLWIDLCELSKSCYYILWDIYKTIYAYYKMVQNQLEDVKAMKKLLKGLLEDHRSRNVKVKCRKDLIEEKILSTRLRESVLEEKLFKLTLSSFEGSAESIRQLKKVEEEIKVHSNNTLVELRSLLDEIKKLMEKRDKNSEKYEDLEILLSISQSEYDRKCERQKLYYEGGTLQIIEVDPLVKSIERSQKLFGDNEDSENKLENIEDKIIVSENKSQDSEDNKSKEAETANSSKYKGIIDKIIPLLKRKKVT